MVQRVSYFKYKISMHFLFNILNLAGDLRVCTYCWNVVHSYLQSDNKADLSADIIISSASVNIAGSEEDRLGANCPPPSTYSSSLRRKTSVGYQEERFALGRLVLFVLYVFQVKRLFYAVVTNYFYFLSQGSSSL